MSNYGILRFTKHKTLGTFAVSGEHTFRERDTPNADLKRTHLNQHGGASSSAELLAALRRKIPKSRRSDAVLAIEVFIGTSPEWMTGASDQERSEFFSRGRQWAYDTFGKENVLYFGTQRDELSDHAVAYVVPLRNGKLNCKYWLGGGDKLSALQDSFALVMEDLGLERGVRGSDAHHQPVRRFYGTLSEGLDRAADRLERIRPDELKTVDELQRYLRELECALWEQEVELALEKRKHELRFEEELRERTNLRYASEGTYVGRIIMLARDYCIQFVDGVGHVIHSLKRFFAGTDWHEYLKDLYKDSEPVAFTYDGKRASANEAWFLARHDPEFRALYYPDQKQPAVESQRDDLAL